MEPEKRNRQTKGTRIFQYSRHRVNGTFEGLTTGAVISPRDDLTRSRRTRAERGPNLVLDPTPCAAGNYPATLCQSQEDTRKGLPSTRGCPSLLVAYQEGSEQRWMKCCLSVLKTRSGTGMIPDQPTAWIFESPWTFLTSSCLEAGVKERHRPVPLPLVLGEIG